MARLRGEEGCPWDKKQTASSIKIYLLEEAYELAEALDQDDPAQVKEELGDLLFQIIFLSRLYQEQGDFDLTEVMGTVYQKMVRRHPHVFGDRTWQSAGEVVQGWQEIKAEEKKGQDPFESLPASLPSLLKAHRIAQRAAGMGFEWADAQEVLAKAREELDEIEEALSRGDQPALREELGDLLFALVNLGRLAGITAENALRQASHKFL
jgi:MazG family protein